MKREITNGLKSCEDEIALEAEIAFAKERIGYWKNKVFDNQPSFLARRMLMLWESHRDNTQDKLSWYRKRKDVEVVSFE